MAILSNVPERLSSEKPEKEVSKEAVANSQLSHNPRLTARQQHIANTNAKIQKWLKEAEEQEQTVIVKLGDASIAAPFTSKLSSIQCSMYKLLRKKTFFCCLS